MMMLSTVSSAASELSAFSNLHEYYCSTDCSCVSKRGKPPFLPNLIHNSHLRKFINDGIIERVEKQKLSGNQFGAWARYESLQGQTCEYRTSSESEQGEDRDCWSFQPARRAVSQCVLGLPLLALFKVFCSALAVSSSRMQTPAESRASSSGFDQEVKCHRPCLVSYISASVFFSFVWKNFENIWP